ncbi:MAG: HprK-related kinase B [Gammaproteobacteria bacterium]|nr:HprK-related kinase B [Gammaproteobacteria bacterium]
MNPINDLNTAVERLTGGATLCDELLILDCEGCRLAIRSNSEQLLSHLRDYFSHLVCEPAKPDLQIIAIEREVVEPADEFTDWKREPGKSGRKDAYRDIPGARLVRKVRTGMLFLQSETQRIASGPCLEYDNQVINFINAQYMNWLQQRSWLICHASGLVRNGLTLGMAGLSGGGKSTLMLQLLDYPDVNYLTNDRLFIRREGGEVQARGIPKLPRINPGTIVTNPTLERMIPAAERQTLLALPKQQLWDLEDKYDVNVQAVYGAGRISTQAPLHAFLVLNWQREGNEPLQLKQIELAQRPDLLSAIMKSPGPFYQYADGSFFQDTTTLDDQAYLHLLKDIPVYEASGCIDFTGLKQRCYSELFQ